MALKGTQIALWTGGAVLLFWIVGAYNRLVSLRNVVARQFVPVVEQISLRHALLMQKLDTLAPVLANAGPRVEALRAASQQAEAACGRARTRPSAAANITSLRLAEEILQDTRARLPIHTAAGLDMTEVNNRLAEVDAALSFARRQFNEAVTDYNTALQEFPTWLVAGLFSFRVAGTL